jgi:hypothetical protein
MTLMGDARTPGHPCVGRLLGIVRDERVLARAPDDVDLPPTSEDGHVAVMAYLALHRRTGETCCLDLAWMSGVLLLACEQALA